MTKEELKNIIKMPFSKVCKLCGKESIYILSRIISCSNCPLFRNKNYETLKMLKVVT